MGKVWKVIAAVIVTLGLSVAIVGCGSSAGPTKDKMTGGQMKDDKMPDGKMGSDKMGNDIMDHGKMDGDRKGKM